MDIHYVLILEYISCSLQHCKTKKKKNFDGNFEQRQTKNFCLGFFLNFNGQKLERINNKVGRVCRKRNVARVFTAFFFLGGFH
jgi:hypothetical protein